MVISWLNILNKYIKINNFVQVILINHITLVVHLDIQSFVPLYFLTFMFGAQFSKEEYALFEIMS